MHIRPQTSLAGTGNEPGPVIKSEAAARALNKLFMRGEAHGATGPEFRAAQEDINALDGHVVILPAQAFDHTSQTLTVAAPLYHVGTYGETKAHGAGPKLRSDSARRGQNGATASTGTGNSRMLRLLVAAVAAAILIVIAYALL